MGQLEWTHQERIGWTDVDQDGLLKFSSIVRFVAAGYAGMFPLLSQSSRAVYFATHELQPIVRHIEMARGKPTARDWTQSSLCTSQFGSASRVTAAGGRAATAATTRSDW